MSNYLVVAHQTATSPELLRRASEIADRDSGALFTLLVPATPVVHLLTWEEGETQEVARLRAAEAKQRFESSALRVEAAKVGDASPMLAIEDELRKNPGKYDAIVLSTLPPGFSRWLGMDVHDRAERKFDLPVIRVVAQRPVKASV